MCTLCQTRSASEAFTCSEGKNGTSAGTGSAGGVSAPLPSINVQQQAAYLTDGYWNAVGWNRHAFDVKAGGTITVNLSGLGTAALETARVALGAWTAVSGLSFQEMTGSAQIGFSENYDGAWANSSTIGQTIVSSVVNVASGWIAYGNYYLQTYIHEIGHALGLGHGGNYNGSADFASNASYQEDSWQMSVMSYFNQDQNPYARGTYAEVATPMMADILAIQSLYGVPANTRTGNDTYGDNRTATGSGTEVRSNLAQTIFDAGGVDTFDFGNRSASQRIDLREGRFSDIDGRLDNLAIALGTVIENAIGGSGHDTITGNAAANRLVGNGGNDALYGEAGDDLLDGGAGNDTLNGGAGTDTAFYRGAYATYAIARTGTGFTVTGEGMDTLTGIERAQFSDGIYDFTQERFVATGSVGPRILMGTDGADTLSAGDGRGWTLYGLGGNDTLLGGRGADTLFGDAGADRMVGGLGDDTYHVDDAGDVVVEWAKGGTDTVNATITYELTATVENLVLGGARAIDGTGNALNNTITGNAADNRLDGGRGADLLQGLGGNDTYLVDDRRDRVVEAANAGIDTVIATVSHTLAENVENLTLAGTRDLEGRGNAGANILLGNAGANALRGEAGDDLLDGGLGRDVLIGGAGSDIFRFSTALGRDNVDRIADFRVHEDRLYLDDAVFTGLALGTLGVGAFKNLAQGPADLDDRILYDARSGALFYDADGSSAGAAVQFATLQNRPAITADDFFIV